MREVIRAHGNLGTLETEPHTGREASAPQYH
jgi:hypothetical protein